MLAPQDFVTNQELVAAGEVLGDPVTLGKFCLVGDPVALGAGQVMPYTVVVPGTQPLGSAPALSTLD